MMAYIIDTNSKKIKFQRLKNSKYYRDIVRKFWRAFFKYYLALHNRQKMKKQYSKEFSKFHFFLFLAHYEEVISNQIEIFVEVF